LIDASAALIQKMPDFLDSWGPVALTPTPFSPVVDGVVLPKAPWRALADGAARGVDLLVGHTRDEYSLFKVHEQIADALPITMDAYRAAYPESSFHQLCETVHADWTFRMPSVHLANAQHAGGGAVWMYELCWGFDEPQGASHSLDLLLVFGTLDADDAGLSAEMRSGWAQFAKEGNPGWDRYDPDRRLTRVYTARPTTQRYPEERSRQIWSAHQFAAL
jgi:para-nitrobenzyl esterase